VLSVIINTHNRSCKRKKKKKRKKEIKKEKPNKIKIRHGEAWNYTKESEKW